MWIACIENLKIISTITITITSIEIFNNLKLKTNKLFTKFTKNKQFYC